MNRASIGDEVIMRAMFRNGTSRDGTGIVSEVSQSGFLKLRDFRRWSTVI